MKDHGRAQETVVIGACVRSSSAFVGFFVGCWTPGGDEVAALGMIVADNYQAFVAALLLHNTIAM